MTDKTNKYYEKLQKEIKANRKKYTVKDPKYTKIGSCIIGIIGCIIAVFLEFNTTANTSDAFSFTMPAMITLIGMEALLGIWAKHTKYLTNQNEIKCGATLGLLAFILISFAYMFIKSLPMGEIGTSLIFSFTFAIVPYFIPLIIYFVKFFPAFQLNDSGGSYSDNYTETYSNYSGEYSSSSNNGQIKVETNIFGERIYKDSKGNSFAKGETNIFGEEIIKKL